MCNAEDFAILLNGVRRKTCFRHTLKYKKQKAAAKESSVQAGQNANLTWTDILMSFESHSNDAPLDFAEDIQLSALPVTFDRSAI